ncbi:MAG TPA: hypothetical protein VNZ58_11305 [Thermomicrobiales bacterium]|nr:hypothetical protein [Thermomicrobiales bacterium]
MIARNMMPENPSTRDFVETTLQEHPSILRFIDRIQHHAQSVFKHPTFKIRQLAFDEWDPPLIMEITAEIPEDEYIRDLHSLRKWYRRDPDFDENILHVSLLIRVPTP